MITISHFHLNIYYFLIHNYFNANSFTLKINAILIIDLLLFLNELNKFLIIILFYLIKKGYVCEYLQVQKKIIYIHFIYIHNIYTLDYLND